jgi:hypothetical protein
MLLEQMGTLPAELPGEMLLLAAHLLQAGEVLLDRAGFRHGQSEVGQLLAHF